MTSSKKLVILGVGNSIRMDDAAGLRVVENLEEDKELQKLDITFKYLHTGGFDILDEINGYKYAIIVDAASMADEGLKPGEIMHIKNLLDLETPLSGGVSSHSMGVLEVLKLARIGGYKIPNPIEIYGVQVKEINVVSEELTPVVAEGVRKLVIILKDKIKQIISDLQ
jgi:hydrogenase maturation protease